MTEYPYTQDGIVRWACCDSTIGPACKHTDTSGRYVAILTYHRGREYSQTVYGPGTLADVALDIDAAPLTAALYRCARTMASRGMGQPDESIGWHTLTVFSLTS